MSRFRTNASPSTATGMPKAVVTEKASAPTRQGRNRRNPVSLKTLRRQLSASSLSSAPPSPPTPPSTSPSVMHTPALETYTEQDDASSISSFGLASPAPSSPATEVSSWTSAREGVAPGQCQSRNDRKREKRRAKRQEERKARRPDADVAVLSLPEPIVLEPIPAYGTPGSFADVIDECLFILQDMEREYKATTSTLASMLHEASSEMASASSEGSDLQSLFLSIHADVLWQEEKVTSLDVSVQSSRSRLASMSHPFSLLELSDAQA